MYMKFLKKNSRKCSKCGKLIKDSSKAVMIHGKPYCRKCAERKKEDDFLTFLMIMDDD